MVNIIDAENIYDGSDNSRQSSKNVSQEIKVKT